jgi:hypothetical protein
VLIERSSVLVPAALAGPLLELAAAEMGRRRERGLVIAEPVRRVLHELATVASEHARGSDQGSDQGSDRFRAPIVGGMTTAAVAMRLGISQRAVIKRLHAGKLHGEQQPDGTWLVQLPDVQAAS